MNFIKFFISRSLLMNLLTALVIIVGLMKLVTMRREAFPSVNFDLVTTTTSYLGASPKEVETYVTNIIEEELKSVDGIKEQSSVSIEGRSFILMKLDPDLSEEKKRQAIRDIQSSVDRVADLPSDIPEPPLVKEFTSGDMPIIEVALSGEAPYSVLQNLADNLSDQIEDIRGISEVSKRGFREKEFWVEVHPKRLAYFNLSFTDIVATLAARNINLPGGAIVDEDGEILIRTIGEVKTPDEIANIVLRANDDGVNIRIKDVANVKRTFEDEKEIFRTDGDHSINLMVKKSETGDIINLVDQVRKISDAYIKSTNNSQVKISYVNDISFFVRNRLGVLVSNGTFGTILVLLTLLMFISPSIATVTAMGMPVAFLASVAVMGYTGMTINLLTMFGMVIVLGMLVDDAIIVAENIWHHYENGENPMDAAVKGTAEVIAPVTATILTTIAAFSPLIMMSGIFGKFMQHLPLVVVIALIMSLFEAMFVLPAHTIEAIRIRESFLKRFSNRKRPTDRKVKVGRIREILLSRYSKSLAIVLRFRYLFMIAISGVFAASLIFASIFMPFILFPSEGIEAFFVRGDLHSEASLHETDIAMAKLEVFLSERIGKAELLNTVNFVGIQQNEPNDPFTQRGSHLGQVEIFLTPEKDRERTAKVIIDSLRQDTLTFAESIGLKNVTFEKVRQGPPVGKPVAIRLRGDDLFQLEKISDELVVKLSQVNGISDVSENYRSGKREFLVEIDEVAAARSLLTVREIAQHLRGSFEGMIGSYVRDNKERVPIRVRFTEETRNDPATLENILIPNRQNNLIPLKEIASIRKEQGVNAIFHRDFKRSITVTAAIDENVTTSELVNKEMLPYLAELERSYPGVYATAGGEWEETGESLQSLKEAFIVALGLIFLILATQFGSLTQPFVVMASIPFGIIGVIWAFYFHGLPLSFLGMIGAIGLTGVIVNDSIVLVDFINKGIQSGMKAYDAVLTAGVRRFRAVWLTTITTVFGLLPLVYGIGGEDKFLQPAAVALGYGLIFGTVLVLFFVPALYLIRMDLVGRIRKSADS